MMGWVRALGVESGNGAQWGGEMGDGARFFS